MFVGLDAVDGTVARLLNRNSKWGAFFDSVLDRIADGVVLGSLAFYFANEGKETYFVLSLVALLASEIVSYTKARAEGLGLNCDTGLAERPERVIIVIAGTFIAGLGFMAALEISMWILTIVSIITVIQRMNFVLKQTKSS
jgi:CDP-diacylglycerol--glycerol-3-phosphate 3-phosphatidyltransferase